MWISPAHGDLFSTETFHWRQSSFAQQHLIISLLRSNPTVTGNQNPTEFLKQSSVYSRAGPGSLRNWSWPSWKVGYCFSPLWASDFSYASTEGSRFKYCGPVLKKSELCSRKTWDASVLTAGNHLPSHRTSAHVSWASQNNCMACVLAVWLSPPSEGASPWDNRGPRSKKSGSELVS